MEKKEIWKNESVREDKPETDVYSLIRSAETRDYYRKTDACDSLEKKIVLIQHGYIPVQKKAAMLNRLLGTGTEEENRLVEEMCRIYDRYIGMVYHPAVRTVFLLECHDLWWNEGGTDYASCGLHDAYESLEEVIAQMEEIYGGEEESASACVAVLQVPQEGRAKVAFRFDMFWIDGKWELQKFDVDDGELALQGNSDDAIEFFSYMGGWQYHPLPFENGCRMKLQLPFMKEPVYGTLESKLDGKGCWYHFLYFGGKEGEANGMVDLTNAEINLHSGYSSIDWIERA